MSPTALAIRYLDSHNQWLNLEPDMRDKALAYIEQGKERVVALITMGGINLEILKLFELRISAFQQFNIVK